MKTISVNNISKQYQNKTALDSISLQFDFGKIYGLLGRNGAGKSTLLNIISNRIFADKGDILVNGTFGQENQEAQALLFLMSEDNLYPKAMKVEKIYEWTKKFYKSFNIEEAIRLSKVFGLDLNKKNSQLSTGYNTIYKLIIALCLEEVPYIFLDEPVLGLDANHRELFYKVLLESYEQNPRTIVIATHLIEEISNLIEDIIIIDDGKVLINSNVDDFMSLGFCVSGKTSDVDAYIKDKKILGFDCLGGLKTAYLYGTYLQSEIPTTLEITKPNIQKMFVELTKKENGV